MALLTLFLGCLPGYAKEAVGCVYLRLGREAWAAGTNSGEEEKVTNKSSFVVCKIGLLVALRAQWACPARSPRGTPKYHM